MTIYICWSWWSCWMRWRQTQFCVVNRVRERAGHPLEEHTDKKPSLIFSTPSARQHHAAPAAEWQQKAAAVLRVMRMNSRVQLQTNYLKMRGSCRFATDDEFDRVWLWECWASVVLSVSVAHEWLEWESCGRAGSGDRGELSENRRVIQPIP